MIGKTIMYAVLCMAALTEIAGFSADAAGKTFTQQEISWTTLGESNEFFYEGIFAVTSDSHGSIYLCGDGVITGGLGLGYAIGRWDGRNWSAYAPGLSGVEINDLAFDKKDRLYAVGRFETTGDPVLKHIAMWDGSKWNPVGNGKPDHVDEIEFDNEGNLFICEPTDSGSIVQKMDTSGNWTVIGNILGTVNCLDIDIRNNIYVSGRIYQADTVTVNKIARWNGKTWENIGPPELTYYDMPVYSYYLECDKSGNIYASGNFKIAGTEDVSGLAMWDGNEWHPLGTDADFAIYENKCMIGPDDNLYLAGEIKLPETGETSYVSRWDGKSWHSLTDGLPSGPHFMMVDKQSTVYISFYEEPYPSDTLQLAYRLFKNSGSGWTDACGGNGLTWSASAVVYDHKGNLYAGGDFNFAGIEQVNNVARWDGNRWNRLGSGLKCSVNDLAIDNNDNLYAGGSYYNGISNTGVMKWNGDIWESISLKDGENSNFRLKDVVVLAFDSKGLLYAGGSTDSGAGLQVWDGNTWSNVGGGITGNSVNAITFDKNGDMYVAGDFTKAGDVVAQSIARFDGSSWYPLGEGIQREPTRLSPVYALAIDSKGILYAGGGFEYAGQVEARNMAKWDGVQWSAMNTKNSQYARNGEVIQHILIDSSDNVFVGGYFDSIGVTIAKNIAVWDGSEWNRFDSNSENDIDGHIYDMAIRDGTLAIAGYFLMAGGKTSSNIAFCQLGSTAPVKKQYSCKNNSGIYFDKSKNALRLTLMSATKVMTSVFTLSGKLISSVSQTLLPGDHLIMADADRIPSGTYIMQVKMPDRSFQFKINRCR